ncbi:MAG TPA: OmpA family protein [Bacteroidia bacterium]|nr:OmpA family protein [Bacteroidia bacterium]
MRHTRILVFIFTLLSLSVFAQREYTSSVPKATRSFDAALKFYDARQNTKALEALEDAINADPKFIEAHMLKANIYSDIRDYEKAIAAFRSAIAINPDFFINNFYGLATQEYLGGHYSEAKADFEKFISYPKASKTLSAKAKSMIESCSFAEEAVKNPVPFNPINMGDSINSADEEYFPAITGDGKTFLFTRRLKTLTADGRRTEQEDFYVSTMGPKGWKTAQPVTEINSDGNEGAPSLSADGQYLFFTACEELFNTSTTQRKTNGSCDLFIAKKVGDKYTNPRNLEIPVNSGAWESQPSFSSDGRTLYFVRAVKGSNNVSQHDIFMSRIGDDARWSDPVSVSDKINTSADELSVFIHPDDQTIYFSSNGHTGMGGQDIFYSKREPNGEWGEAVNIGYPINTPNDEASLLVSPDGEVGFFSSDRPGGKGGEDLYQFNLYEKARPQPVTYMKGKVYDVDTKKPLGASFELIDLATGKIVVRSTSNSVSGQFIVCLPAGKTYALNVSKDGYIFYSDNFELKDAKSSKDPVLKDVPMKPIKAGQSIVLKNIFYETDKFDLKDESKTELTKLMDFLNKNPKVHFEISGHTDNVGSKPYNQTLSEKRAKTVYDYLIAAGIPAQRLSSKGYGDTKPISDNTTDAGRSQNRRTEFLITSVDQ